MLVFIYLAALIGGLLMFLLTSNAKTQRIGELLLLSSFLALLIAIVPATVKLLQG